MEIKDWFFHEDISEKLKKADYRYMEQLIYITDEELIRVGMEKEGIESIRNDVRRYFKQRDEYFEHKHHDEMREIDSIDIPVRIYNCMKRAGINGIVEFWEAYKEGRPLYHMGRKTLQELLSILSWENVLSNLQSSKDAPGFSNRNEEETSERNRKRYLMFDGLFFVEMPEDSWLAPLYDACRDYISTSAWSLQQRTELMRKHYCKYYSDTERYIFKLKYNIDVSTLTDEEFDCLICDGRIQKWILDPDKIDNYSNFIKMSRHEQAVNVVEAPLNKRIWRLFRGPGNSLGLYQFPSVSSKGESILKEELGNLVEGHNYMNEYLDHIMRKNGFRIDLVSIPSKTGVPDSEPLASVFSSTEMQILSAYAPNDKTIGDLREGGFQGLLKFVHRRYPSFYSDIYYKLEDAGEEFNSCLAITIQKDGKEIRYKWDNPDKQKIVKTIYKDIIDQEKTVLLKNRPLVPGRSMAYLNDLLFFLGYLYLEDVNNDLDRLIELFDNEKFREECDCLKQYKDYLAFQDNYLSSRKLLLLRSTDKRMLFIQAARSNRIDQLLEYAVSHKEEYKALKDDFLEKTVTWYGLEGEYDRLISQLEQE